MAARIQFKCRLYHQPSPHHQEEVISPSSGYLWSPLGQRRRGQHAWSITTYYRASLETLIPSQHHALQGLIVPILVRSTKISSERVSRPRSNSLQLGTGCCQNSTQPSVAPPSCFLHCTLPSSHGIYHSCLCSMYL